MLLDNRMIIVKKVAMGEDPLTLPMNSTEIWVQVHQLPFGFMDKTIGELAGSHIGKLVKYDEDNNYGPWRKYMRLRVEIALEEPLQQDLVIERSAGGNIRLLFNYEKLGKFCFICGSIGHTDNFCQKKFETNFVAGHKRWGPHLRAENNSFGGGSASSKWIIDGRSSNSGGRPVEGTSINEGQTSQFNAGNNSSISNHRFYGRIKVEIELLSRSLIIYKYSECQRSNGEGMVQWWTVVDPKDLNGKDINMEGCETSKGPFVPELTKSDQINKFLAEGMTEGDRMLCEHGEKSMQLLRKERIGGSYKNVSPQHSNLQAYFEKNLNEDSDSMVGPVSNSQARGGMTFVEPSTFQVRNNNLGVGGLGPHGQLLINKAITTQSLAMSPILMPIEFMSAAGPLVNEKTSNAGRTKGLRKDKTAANKASQQKSLTLARNPIQPDSFMASARVSYQN